MPHFAANLIFDGQEFIKNAYISTDENGTICYLSNEGEALIEKHGLSFYNGILCPGFVNSHCHLELSGNAPYNGKEKSLAKFINHVIANRETKPNLKKIKLFDRIMFENGISLVGDVSNTDISCNIKQKSKIKYHTFVELSGLDNNTSLAQYRRGENILQTFKNNGLTARLSLHSLYSVSDKLFKLVSNREEEVLSIHFMESPEELELFSNQSGSLFYMMKSIFAEFKPLVCDIDQIVEILKGLNSSQLILVHNLMLKNRFVAGENFRYCLCPNSNMIISGHLPDKNFVKSIANEFIIGTDSIVSNNNLCILSEIKTLAKNYDFLKLAELLQAATLNGAKALKCDDNYGSFEIGKKPGVILIEGVDIKNFKLTDDSVVKRLI